MNHSDNKPNVREIQAPGGQGGESAAGLRGCSRTGGFFDSWPIRRKVIAVIMLTSVAALLLTTVAFTVYDLFTYRQTSVHRFSELAAILAEHSASALQAQDAAEGQRLLAALRADPEIMGAAVYDRQGKLFAQYHPQEPFHPVAGAPAEPGYRLEQGQLIVTQPIAQARQFLGMLYLRAEFRPVHKRLTTYIGIAGLVLVGSLLAAWGLSQLLERRITGPLLALAQTAHDVSARGDFSLRAARHGSDEIGRLTDAFNEMLERLQGQNAEMRENRARLSGIIGSAMDAIISVNAEQRIQLFNAAAEKMFRCRAEDVMGEPLDRLIPERFRRSHRAAIEQFGHTGVTSRAMGKLHPLLVGLRADGEEFPIEASISQVEVSGQKVFTVILRDITERLRAERLLEEQIAERKRAEDEVRRMNLELEHRVEARTAELSAANQELEAFTYTVAHDLRAPLRHIDAFGRLLEEEYSAQLPPEAQRFIATIRGGSRHMSQLVDDLLNLARVGRQELKRQPTSLRPLLDEVIAELKRETEDRTIEWRLLPLPTVDCDPGLMRQVLTNLISNAIKYTRPRSPAVIEVGSLQVQGSAVIYVRDNGVGFNMKYADKLFGVFQRLHRHEDFEGTGVGLATVQRILRKHGGCAWAEAAVDKGSVFYFTVDQAGIRANAKAEPGGR